MIVARAPLRISLAGGGTDWPDYARAHGGLVVTAAIDKYVTVTLSERFEREICLVWREHLEVVDRHQDLEHGIIRECLRLLDMPQQRLEIHTIGDVPGRGSGLGSSSALTVATLKACHAWREREGAPIRWATTGLTVKADELAREACHVERELLGAPIGVQDQYIAAHGGCQALIMGDSVHAEPLRIGQERLQRLNDSLALYYTGIARSSATVMASRDDTSEGGLAALAKTRAIADQMRAVVEDPAADLDQVGELLHESWLAKQRWTPAANTKHIERKYRFLRTQGALGGKLCGAGGGGFLLVYMKPEDRARLGTWTWSDRLMPFRFEALAPEARGVKVV